MLIALRLLLLFTLLLGVAYPWALTGLGKVLFPRQAAGDPDLVGRNFEGDGYFWGRPSATPEKPYNAALSSGSNWGPREPRLAQQRDAALQCFKGSTPPEDLLTASGSGLDPHITPEAARFQIPRVARARGMSEARLRALVESHCEPPTLGVLGHARVHVGRLNRALDAALTSSPGTLTRSGHSPG